MKEQADLPVLRSIEAHVVPVSGKTTWLLVEAHTSDGSTGYGEATAFGEEPAVLAEIELLKARIRDADFRLVGHALRQLDSAQMPSARLILKSALEQALLDALARRAGLPLALLLGGPCRDRVPCYANINRGITDRSPEGFAARAKAVLLRHAYGAVKIAPFDGLRWSEGTLREQRALFDAGLARIAAVRAAVGEDIDLLVDCHWRLSPSMADRLLREAESLRLLWVEDPVDPRVVPADERRALRSTAHARATMIAGGELVRSLDEARTFLAAGGHDVFLPDLRLTGVRQGMAALELAVASGVHASLHNPVGPVLDAVSRHVAAAVPSLLVLERQVDESPLYDAIRGSPADVREGAVSVGTEPGFGFVPDAKVLSEVSAPTTGKAGTSAGRGGPDA